MVHKDSFKLIQ